MKWIVFLLLLPFIGYGQTAHLEDDKVVYKEKVEVKGISANDLYNRLSATLNQLIDAGSRLNFVEDSSKKQISAIGEFKLQSTNALANKAQYAIKVVAGEESYKYIIDDVFLIQKKRGAKATITSSEDVLKNMEVNGPISIETEKILNEMDMNFQKIIALLERAVKQG